MTRGQNKKEIDEIQDEPIKRKIYAGNVYNTSDIITVFKHYMITILTTTLNILDFDFFPNKFKFKVEIDNESKHIFIFLFCIDLSMKERDLGHLSLFFPDDTFYGDYRDERNKKGSIHYSMHPYRTSRVRYEDVDVYHILFNRTRNSIEFQKKDLSEILSFELFKRKIDEKIKLETHSSMLVNNSKNQTMQIIEKFIRSIVDGIATEINYINQHSQFGGYYSNYFYHCY